MINEHSIKDLYGIDIKFNKDLLRFQILDCLEWYLEWCEGNADKYTLASNLLFRLADKNQKLLSLMLNNFADYNATIEALLKYKDNLDELYYIDNDVFIVSLIYQSVSKGYNNMDLIEALEETLKISADVIRI